jgi:hypothetical protein
MPLFHYISFYCAFCVFRRRNRRHPGNPRCGTLRRRHTPAPEKHMTRSRPMKTRRPPHSATRTAPPASGPRATEPGNYRCHGGSRRTQRTADNPTGAQSTPPHAPAFPACATSMIPPGQGDQIAESAKPSRSVYASSPPISQTKPLSLTWPTSLPRPPAAARKAQVGSRSIAHFQYTPRSCESRPVGSH